jgi:hypothetical protein
LSPVGLISIENAAPDLPAPEEQIALSSMAVQEPQSWSSASGISWLLSRRFMNSAYVAVNKTTSRPIRNISSLATSRFRIVAAVLICCDQELEACVFFMEGSILGVGLGLFNGGDNTAKVSS